MKKREFKLIKKYPGSLDVGTILYLDNNLYIHWGTNLNKEVVENNPEFFEEIIEKTKPVLLVTEDGKQLLENNSYWFIWLSDKVAARHQKGMTAYGPFHVRPLTNEDGWSKDAKHFSTKEAAQEWIVLNKPVLSINDIVNISKGTNTMDMIGERLKELVKSRL